MHGDTLAISQWKTETNWKCKFDPAKKQKHSNNYYTSKLKKNIDTFICFVVVIND